MDLAPYHKLVHYVAQTWWKSFNGVDVALDYDDLVQEAYMVCMNALEGYDEARGFAFSTYFVSAARRHFFRMLSKIRKSGPISVEITDQNALFEMTQCHTECPESAVSVSQELGRSIERLSPLARAMLELVMTPPDELQDEFKALEHKRDEARRLGIDERHPQELNINFVGALMAQLGFSKHAVSEAKKEIREWESSYEV